MALRCGLVGLPNAGKSTIFNALSRGAAEVGNFPFCTIQPNVCLVDVPDERIDVVAERFSCQKKSASAIEFVDIAGLVEGSSQGEGMGNQFLAHIREAAVLLHVLRCFDDEEISHVKGLVDPLSDLEIVNTELILSDLESVERRMEKIKKKRPVERGEVAALEAMHAHLSEGRLLNTLPPREQDAELRQFLLTAKPLLYVCNTSEQPSEAEQKRLKALSEALGGETELVVLSGKIESDIALLDSAEERQAFLDDLGIAEPGLHSFIRAAYRLLGLSTFFTAGPKEVRAWAIPTGCRAEEAAGVIHTDFQKGFICAEVYHYDDLMRYTSEKAVREAGKLRREGKDYAIQDGDIVFFRWNL